MENPLYQLFISSVPSKVTMLQLQEKLDSIASQDLTVIKQKAKGRNKRVYNILIETSNFESFTKLRNHELKIEETIVQIRKYTEYNLSPNQPSDRDERKVYVGDLPEAVEAQCVREALESFGKVDDIFVRRGVRNQAVYALVTFSWRSDADVACSQGKVPFKNSGYLSIRKYHPHVSKSNKRDKGSSQTSKRYKKKAKDSQTQNQGAPIIATPHQIPVFEQIQEESRIESNSRQFEAAQKTQTDPLNRQAHRTAPQTRQSRRLQHGISDSVNQRNLQIPPVVFKNNIDSVLKSMLVLRQLGNHKSDNLRFNLQKQ